MTNKEFLIGLANGKSDILQQLLDILEAENINYCVIGGLAVNAYVEPVVSLDLDLVVTTSMLERLKSIAGKTFEIKEFPYSLNLYNQDSDLRIQVQKDERYQSFVDRAQESEILGYKMKVACLDDVLNGKIWACSDERRRKSKRQKDLADISRIIESFPELESLLTDDIREKIL